MMDFLSYVCILCLLSSRRGQCAKSNLQADILGLLCSDEWLQRPLHPVMTDRKAISWEHVTWGNGWRGQGTHWKYSVLQGSLTWGYIWAPGPMARKVLPGPQATKLFSTYLCQVYSRNQKNLQVTNNQEVLEDSVHSEIENPARFMKTLRMEGFTS